MSADAVQTSSNGGDPIELDMEIVAEFLLESRDHLSAYDDQLLVLENDATNQQARALEEASGTLRKLTAMTDQNTANAGRARAERPAWRSTVRRPLLSGTLRDANQTTTSRSD